MRGWSRPRCYTVDKRRHVIISDCVDTISIGESPHPNVANHLFEPREPSNSHPTAIQQRSVRARKRTNRATSSHHPSTASSHQPSTPPTLSPSILCAWSSNSVGDRKNIRFSNENVWQETNSYNRRPTSDQPFADVKMVPSVVYPSSVFARARKLEC